MNYLLIDASTGAVVLVSSRPIEPPPECFRLEVPFTVHDPGVWIYDFKAKQLLEKTEERRAQELREAAEKAAEAELQWTDSREYARAKIEHVEDPVVRKALLALLELCSKN